MYFGVLAVGADVTGGFLAMNYIQASKSKINLIFKDFHADFLKRAEDDVHFVCEDGIAIQNLVILIKRIMIIAVPLVVLLTVVVVVMMIVIVLLIVLVIVLLEDFQQVH